MNEPTNTDAQDDALRMTRAAAYLDGASDAIDARTQAALVQARVNAAEAARTRRQRFAWGGAGLGFALAASLAVLVVLPEQATQPASGNAVADVLAEQDLALASSDEAIADDMAFVAWLEENPDA